MTDSIDPIAIPMMSAIESHTYSLNLSAVMLLESMFIAQIKKANEAMDIVNKYLDSLTLESPNASIANPPANDKHVKEINQLGRKISQ